jgi:hypothetical protein
LQTNLLEVLEMQIKYSGDLQKDMRRMVNETKKLMQNFQHIPRAWTVPLGGVFHKDEFARLVTLLAANKLRSYKR